MGGSAADEQGLWVRMILVKVQDVSKQIFLGCPYHVIAEIALPTPTHALGGIFHDALNSLYLFLCCLRSKPIDPTAALHANARSRTRFTTFRASKYFSANARANLH